MANSNDLRKPLLYALIASVLVGAALGMFLILRGKWGWIEVRILLTLCAIAVSSLAGLSCEIARRPTGHNLFSKFGLVLTVAALGLVLAGIWIEAIDDDELYWKLTSSVSIFAVSVVHVCLLSVARLPARFAWVYLVAMQVIFGLAALLVFMLITEWETDDAFRLAMVLGILDAALTITIPLLHRIGRMEDRSQSLTPLDERSVANIDAEIASLRRQIERLEKLRSEIAGK